MLAFMSSSTTYPLSMQNNCLYWKVNKANVHVLTLMLWSGAWCFAIPALSQNDWRDGPTKSSTRGSWSHFTSFLRSLSATNNICTLIKYYHLLSVLPFSVSSIFNATCTQFRLTSLAPVVLLLGGSVIFKNDIDFGSDIDTDDYSNRFMRSLGLTWIIGSTLAKINS